MYGAAHYGQITYGGQAVYAAPTGVTEDIINSATNTPSLYEPATEDYLTNIMEGVPSLYPEFGVAGEENIIENFGINTPSMDDFIISLQDEYTNIGVASQIIAESIAETLGSSQINTPYLEAQEDYLTTSAVSTQTIIDIVNGNVTETVDAPGPLSINDHEGYNVSGLAVHTVVEEELIDVGSDENPPMVESIWFDNTETIYIVWNELLDPLSVPPTSAFDVDVNGVPVTVLSVIIVDDQIQITISGSLGQLSEVEIRYTPDAVYPIQDLAGNDAAPFSTYTVDEVEDPETGDPVPFPEPTWTSSPPVPIPTKNGGQVLPSSGPAGISLLDVSFRAYSFHRKTGVG